MESVLDVTVDWVRERLKEGTEPLFIELRHPGDVDFSVHRVRGALRLNTDEAQTVDLPAGRIVVVCSDAPNDEPAYQLAGLLRERGFTAYALLGGLKSYLAAGLPVEEVKEAAEMTRLRGL